MTRFRKIIRTVAICLGTALLSGTTASARSEYWQQRVSLFELLPVSEDDIVFLGNSITDGGEFAELLNNPAIKNRGINGDVIAGVRERLPQVTDGSPRKIFLLIGINDISHNLPADELASQYETLVDEIVRKAPASSLYIQSVMPINNDFGRYRNLKDKENVIVELNKRLQEIAVAHNSVFIDLTETLAGPDGKLRKDFTNDGLHLTGPGYKAWTEIIRQYIEQ